jgi:hypothetical protein
MTTTPQSYKVGGFHITTLKEHDTHDGVAFVCTIREHSKPVGTAEQAGQGGCCTLLFKDRAASDRFTAAAHAYQDQHGEPEAIELNDQLLYHLIEGFELDRDAKKKTICRSSLTDDLGIYKHREFMPPLRLEQLAQVTGRYPDCTHVWIIGVGWTPLT